MLESGCCGSGCCGCGVSPLTVFAQLLLDLNCVGAADHSDRYLAAQLLHERSHLRRDLLRGQAHPSAAEQPPCRAVLCWPGLIITALKGSSSRSSSRSSTSADG